MFRIATARLQADGGHFLFTGEVVGQRPMSQRLQAMQMIDREAGVENRIVRPLCGKLLPETYAEQQGWLTRDELLDFQGRTRKPQLALAREYGIVNSESPAGGCLLTDPGFAVRMRDLLRYCDPTLDDVNLLKVGRHFRLNDHCKAVLGRNAKDCEDMLGLLKGDALRLDARDTTGPTATLVGRVDEASLRQAAALVLRYTGRAADGEQVVTVRRAADDANVREITVCAMSEAEANSMLIAAEGGGSGARRGGE